jgi:aspartate/methionine/tyrosine aminotransferase
LLTVLAIATGLQGRKVVALSVEALPIGVIDCVPHRCWFVIMLIVHKCTTWFHTGMYLWAKLPASWKAAAPAAPNEQPNKAHHKSEELSLVCDGNDDMEFSRALLAATGVAVSPGSAFGPGGRGHVRIALVAPPSGLRDAAQRIGAWLANR